MFRQQEIVPFFVHPPGIDCEDYRLASSCASDQERFKVLGMLLENLGIDKVLQSGKREDGKAAIADLEKSHGKWIRIS